MDPDDKAHAHTYSVGGCPLFGGGVIGILPNVKLVRWEKVDVWLLEALEDGPWTGRTLRPWAIPLGARPPPAGSHLFLWDLTFPHFPGELVMLQQGWHPGSHILLQDGLHSRTPTAQAEVKVSKPEHPIEPAGDIR